jgi:hypothetical protein
MNRESSGSAALVFVVVASVFYALTTALFFRRRHLFPLKTHFPALTIFATFWCDRLCVDINCVPCSLRVSAAYANTGAIK